MFLLVDRIIYSLSCYCLNEIASKCLADKYSQYRHIAMEATTIERVVSMYLNFLA